MSTKNTLRRKEVYLTDAEITELTIAAAKKGMLLKAYLEFVIIKNLSSNRYAQTKEK